MAIAAALVAAVTQRAAAGTFDLIEPAASPIREIEEVGPSPRYYRLPPNTVGYLSRSTIGAHTRLSDGDTRFAFDALVGASIRFGRDAALGVWIEGGYAYVKGREHLAVLGVGLAHRKPGPFSRSYAVIPHVIAGRIDGEGAVGVRTSVIAGVAAFSIEVAHQVAVVGGTPIHELHFGLTFPFVSGLE